MDGFPDHNLLRQEEKSLNRHRFSQKKQHGRQTVSFDSVTSSASTSASENSAVDLGAISLPSNKRTIPSFKVLSRSLTGTYFGKEIGAKPSTAPAGYENISMTQQRSFGAGVVAASVQRVKIHRSPVRAQSLANQYTNPSQHESCVSNALPIIPKRSKSATFDFGHQTKNNANYKVLEFLHCGTVETSLDISWLCSNKIDILMNLNSIEKVKNKINCYCGNSKFHSPKEYMLKFDVTDSSQNLMKKFNGINIIIAEARSKGNQVLLFDNDGYSCQLVSIQYIMQYFYISLNSAMAHLERIAKVRIPDNFLTVLKLWEHNTLEQSSKEFNFPTNSRKKNISSQRKIAWS